MNLFDLLKEHAGMSQEEAENYFHIENTASEWTLKSIRYLEPTKFRAVVALAKEYGGDYDATPGVRCIHIPKESVPNPASNNQKLEEALGHTPPSKATLSKAEEEDVAASRKEIQEGKAKTFKTTEELITDLHKDDGQTTEEYALSRSLKGKLGQLVPCLEDAEGRIFDGIHRKAIDPKAWTVKLDKVKTPVDRALARMTVNFCRRHYMPEEMQNDIGLLIGSNFTVEQIAETTGISERTVYRYMPESAKDMEKSEAISKGIQKVQQVTAVTSFPKIQDTPVFPRIEKETLNELVECASCHMAFHVSKATVVDDKYYCPQHADQAKPPLKQGFTRASSIAKDSWEHRKAQMSPQHSGMEQAILNKLSGKDLNVMTDFEFCLQKTTPDFWFPDKRIAVYVDGPVHVGREDRDEALRELLRKRHGVNVVTVAYVADTEMEREGVFSAVMEAVKA